MADTGDLAAEREQFLRDKALARHAPRAKPKVWRQSRRGLASRVTEIPEPHYDDAPAEQPADKGEG